MQPFTCSKLTLSHSLVAILCISYFTLSATTRSIRSQPQSESDTNNTNFIKTSCGVTRYPDLCFKSLCSYASTIQTSPMELANAALNVSLESAKSTSKEVTELSKGPGLAPREAQAVADCVDTMGDSVDELQISLVAMKDLEGPDFQEKMSNVMTWVSAALTNEDTCMDGFEENANKDGKTKRTIRKYIVNLAQLTSNALALINNINSN